MIINMIGGDQIVPGAGGGGAKPFSVIERADVFRASGKSGQKSFTEIEQHDIFPQGKLDPKRVAERKALDEKQIKDAFRVLEDLAIVPGWRDIYEAQKRNDKIEEVLKLSRPSDRPAIKTGWRDQISPSLKTTK